MEGLLDVRIIQALYRSAKTTRPVKLPKIVKRQRPSLRQQIRRSPVDEPELVKVKSASQD
jgi:glucose-fructose oxidoreductase